MSTVDRRPGVPESRFLAPLGPVLLACDLRLLMDETAGMPGARMRQRGARPERGARMD